MQHDSTIKDANIVKQIYREEFVWTIVAFISNEIRDDIDDCMSFTVDESFRNDALSYFENIDNMFHQRFEFVNNVLIDYGKYKNDKINRHTNSIEKEYICDRYMNFWDEYEDIDDEQLREYILKTSIYKILMKNRCLSKIKNAME